MTFAQALKGTSIALTIYVMVALLDSFIGLDWVRFSGIGLATVGAFGAGLFLKAARDRSKI